jgi:2-hydroxychromene-2-carboxylate isomerase
MPPTDAPTAVLHELTFFYDPVSPYAYLAFQQLPQALMGLSVHVRYRPVLFAALLKAHGQLGPAEIPGKREWTYRQVAWLAHQHGVPLDLPAAHPFNPLPLLRLGLATAIEDAPGDTNRYVTERLFHHVWRGGGDAGSEDRIAELQERLQDHMRERQKPWQAPDGEAVKQRLRANTEEALALGVFGVPSVVSAGRVFWGLDALPLLRGALDDDPWFRGGAWESAAALPLGAARRG